MTLPLLLSVPHAGLEVPEALRGKCLLDAGQIARDGDEGAAEVYDLAGEVAAFATTGVARAVLDLNRPEDDRRRDGVVKTHTCWDEPVWRTPLTGEEIEGLLAGHHRPYHARLRAAAGTVAFGVDGHTMAAKGPPVGPDPGAGRPAACLGSGGGAFPAAWVGRLRDELARRLPGPVTVDDPFAGGFITRTHGREMPWVQLELSRGLPMPRAEQRRAVLAALTAFCAGLEDPRR